MSFVNCASLIMVQMSAMSFDLLAAILPPVEFRLEAKIGHEPYDTVNTTRTECQLRLDPRIIFLVDPVIRKKHFHIMFTIM